MSNEGLVGSYLGRYKIEELVGRGGMAEVYRATQINLDRFVAIKIMHRFLSDDRDFLSRFEREARVMAKIRHPNIVHVHDYEVHDDYYYIVMDYLPGGTLKNLLDKLSVEGGVIDLAQAAKVTLEIGEALGYAHNIGMVHRDIKPANIMFDEKGIAVLTDFGIARMVGGTTHTTTGSMIGTPAYMSPEQGLGESGDERSDIYSLGVLAYHLFTGRLPFEGDTPLSVVLKHINENPPMLSSINPDIPKVLEDIVLKAMDKNPDNRWRSVLEMNQEIRKALQKISDGEELYHPPTGTSDFPTPVPSLTVPNSEHDSLAQRMGRTPVTHNFADNLTTMLGEAAFQENAAEFTMEEPHSAPEAFTPPAEPEIVQPPEFEEVENQNLLPDLDAAPLFAPSPLPEPNERVDRMRTAPPANNFQQPSVPTGPHQMPNEFDTFDVYREIEAERGQAAVTQNQMSTISEADIAAEREYSSEMSSFMKGFDKKASKEVKFKPTTNPLVKKARRQRTFRGINTAIRGILVAFFVVAGIIFGILYVTRFAPSFNVQERVDDILDNPNIEEVDLSGITAENAIVLSPFTRDTLNDTGLVLTIANRTAIPARWEGSLEYSVIDEEADEGGLVPITVEWQPVAGKRVAFDSSGEIAWEIDGSFPENATFRWVLHPTESSNEIIGTSEEFTLPEEDGEILEISISS